MKVPFYEIRDYREIGVLLDRAHARVMESGQYILGPEVDAFEYEFAKYNGAAYCVAVGNGLDALTLTLRAWGIGPGDEVIVPSNTYIATWLAVSNCGAKPVPVEPDASYNIAAAGVEAAITSRTRACIVVHLYGRMANLLAIHEVCRRYGLYVLSDAAQGAGLTGLVQYDGAAAFSFYPTKNLGCFGDGGAVITNDGHVAGNVRELANYGSSEKYYNRVRGINSRLDELQAAYLRIKLDFLKSWNLSRRLLAERYIANLKDVAGLTLPSGAGSQHVWHLFVVRTAQRDRLRSWLRDEGIRTMVHYPLPPHLQEAYADHAFPILWVAATMADEVLSLPLWPGMDPALVDYVSGKVAEFFAP